jgi:hypothetical protein
MSEKIVKHYKVLIELIRDKRVKKFLELGVWKSQTTRKVLKAVGENMEEYWAIDQWALLGPEHGRMSRRTQQNWDCMYHYACNLMTWFPPLKVMRLESKLACELFRDEHFDFVYLDGSHFYEDVLRDIKLWLPKVRLGGLIGGHDYMTSRGVHQGVRRAVDEIFGKDSVRAYDNGSSVWVTGL